MDHKNLISTLQQRVGDPRTPALLDALTEIIREQSMHGNRIALPGFGSFEGVKHEDEIITDLSTGKRMLLPPSIDVTFQPGSMLRKKIKEGTK
ncbi:MAG: HU family DNA-binding protein [Muribaculaceae bacterium]|nr:HU family DNA-binding protein [Muribaculaceae bacterium]